MLYPDPSEKLTALCSEARIQRIMRDQYRCARHTKQLERRKAWQALMRAVYTIIALELPRRTA